MAYTSGIYDFTTNKYDLYTFDRQNGQKGLNDAIKDLKENKNHRMSTTQFNSAKYAEYHRKTSNKSYSELIKIGKQKDKKIKKTVLAANRAIDNFTKIVTETIPYLEKQWQNANDIISLKIDNREVNKIAKQIRSEIYKQIKIKEKEAIREAKKGRKVIKKATNYTVYSNYKNEAQGYYIFARSIFDKVSNFTFIPKPQIKTLKENENKIKISNGYVSDVKKEIEQSRKVNIDSIKEKSEKTIEKLTEISLSLSSIDDKNLKNEIKKELPTINRIVSPKLVSVSEKSYNKIKESQLAAVDIEMVQAMVNKANFALGANKKRIDQLKKALDEQLKIEQKKQSELGDITNKTKKIISFANENAKGISRTVDSYLQNKKDISTLERQINNFEELKNKSILDEEELKSSPEYIESQYIEGGDVKIKHYEVDKSNDFNKLMEERNKISEEIAKNKNQIQNRKNKKIVLPDEYKNLKKKIKENSQLKKAINAINNEKGRSL